MVPHAQSATYCLTFFRQYLLFFIWAKLSRYIKPIYMACLTSASVAHLGIRDENLQNRSYGSDSPSVRAERAVESFVNAAALQSDRQDPGAQEQR